MLGLTSAASAETVLEEAAAALVRSQAADDVEAVRVTLHGNTPVCADPELFLPHGKLPPRTRISIGARCSEPPSTSYLQAEVALIGTYPVLAEDVSAGTVITEAMLKLTSGDRNQLPVTAVRKLSAAIGQETRRTLPAGSVLQARQLQQPVLVDRGDSVSVQVRGSNFQVSREGTAMQPGARGEQIRVRLAPRQHLEAEVIAPGRVRVEP